MTGKTFNTFHASLFFQSTETLKHEINMNILQIGTPLATLMEESIDDNLNGKLNTLERRNYVQEKKSSFVKDRKE